jgi:two-component system, OmpR family, phosphate regulon sensor histidine kinase PhoR
MLFYVIRNTRHAISFIFISMKKRTGVLILLCSLAIAGLLALQFYWINSFYAVHKTGFEKEVNLAFEDAIKKEFSLRCDTITAQIINRLMDTTEFTISSQLKEDHRTYEYTVFNQHNLNDKWSFSLADINLPLRRYDTTLKRMVAERFAETLRSHDLESHVVWYRTQNLGNFMNDKMKEFNFDTARLRKVFDYYLQGRAIAIPYVFYLKQQDSTMNKNQFPAALLSNYPVITKSYPTYKLIEDNHYVRALFTNPSAYIKGKMKAIFISSLVLVLSVCACIISLFKLWSREKRLSAIKNDFINNITHEFKTPIATVSAAIEAMSDFDVLQNKEKTSRYLSHAKHELLRLASLVDKVLNISVYENKLLRLQFEAIHFNDIIVGIIQTHQLSNAKKIDYQMNNKSALTTISADKIQFHHAINNIIDNAIKYSGENLLLQINCSIKDGYLLIAIADNGIGLQATDIPLVFEKFYRVKNQQNQFIKGHGLGLSYVKAIMEQHGGWCLLKSKHQAGVEISLAWPI